MADSQWGLIGPAELTGAAKALLSQTTVVPEDGGWTFKVTAAAQDYLDQLEDQYGAGSALQVSWFVARMHRLIQDEAAEAIDGGGANG